MDSLEVVGPERVFLEGDIVRSKNWVRLVKFSEVQRLFECCCLIYIYLTCNKVEHLLRVFNL